MAFSRRTLVSGLAALGASMSVLAGAASAQADIAITSPAHSPEGYTNDLTPDVTFTGAASNGVVTLEIDAEEVGSTLADGSGSGTVTPDVDITSEPMGGRRFGLTVRSTGAGMDTVTVNIDQTPSMSGTTGSDPVAADGVYFHASSAIPENAVKLYIDGVFNRTVTADEDGNYFADIVPTGTLTAGPHTAWLTSVDDNEIESSASETVNLSVAPAAPEFTNFFDQIELNHLTSNVTLVADPDATKVTLYHIIDINDVGTEVEIAQTDDIDDVTGAATIAATLAEGGNSLVAKQTVEGVETVSYLGNNGPIQAFVNTTAPVLETSFQGTVTNWNTPNFHASNVLHNNDADRHTFTALYVDGERVGISDADGNGGDSSVNADDPILDGAHSAYVVTVDHLGRDSATPSNTVNFTIDTVGPAAPTVVSPANGSTTTTSLPVLTVTAEPGSVAHVLVDDVGEEIYETVDANGNVTFTLTQALADGAHTVYLYARDAAGNYGEFAIATFTVQAAKAPVPPAPTPPTPTPPTPPAPNPVDLDGDGITNNWLVGGKAAPAPATPKAKVSSDKVELKLTTAPKGATKIRVYRADGKGAYKLVKTVTAKTKSFTDKKVKAGHTYKYKTVGVNAKGQQGKASGTATAKVKKKK